MYYRDICKNGLHIWTHEENNEEYLFTTKTNRNGYDIIERIHSLPSGLYYTYTKLISYVMYKMIGWDILVYG
jgi:hypothetical protein